MERVRPGPCGPHLLRGLHLHLRVHRPRHHHLHLLLQDHQDHQVQGKLHILTVEGATPELHIFLNENNENIFNEKKSIKPVAPALIEDFSQ